MRKVCLIESELQIRQVKQGAGNSGECLDDAQR